MQKGQFSYNNNTRCLVPAEFSEQMKSTPTLLNLAIPKMLENADYASEPVRSTGLSPYRDRASSHSSESVHQ